MLLLLVDDTQELVFHVESALAPYQAQIECAHSQGTLEAALGSTAPYDLILVNLTRPWPAGAFRQGSGERLMTPFTVVLFDPTPQPASSRLRASPVPQGGSPSSPTLFGWLFKQVAAECMGGPLRPSPRRAGGHRRLRDDPRQLEEDARRPGGGDQVAASNANVCIVGESGTGKELIARAVHTAAPAATGPS